MRLRAMAAQADVRDPADQMPQQALRVLLGSGSAQAVDAQSFTFGGRRYRGTFSASADGRIINTVPLEQYLYSVVPREMPPSWPAAALQAQAIVARTFVLQRSAPEREYDLVPSEADQVYTGIDAEHRQTSAAVDASASRVLRYGNGFALAMYSSCCGGHTESSNAAWGGTPVAYLNGVPCTYCAQAPWYSWKQSLDLDRVQASLSELLPADAQVQDVHLDGVDASGRARFWIFETSAAQTRIPAGKVRSGLGSRVVPSLRVKRIEMPAQAPRTLVIEGAGLGHGVGLCQWGARGMALEGSGAAAILTFYYPGTGIGND
ncbi:MAG: SpoIID/LytB domain-containing protein [Candidatus Baltobacteraceae bacterium]